MNRLELLQKARAEFNRLNINTQALDEQQQIAWEASIMVAYTQAIEDAKGVMPEKRTRDYYRPAGGEYREGEHDGWNAHHAAVITALDKLRS